MAVRKVKEPIIKVTEQEKIDRTVDYYNPWTYNNRPFLSCDIGDAFSFVYLLTEVSTGKRYIGKKIFLSAKTKQVKGVKKKIKVESDWKTYYSSSDYINDQISEGEQFQREILAICFSKGQANYMEARIQMDLRVLEKPDVFLNGIINCKIHKTHVKMDKLMGYNSERIEELKLI